MRRARLRAFVATSVAVALLVLAGTANAGVPRGFIGMNVDGPALAAGGDVSAQLRAIRRSGAGSVRWSIDWAAVQPYRTWADVPPERRAEFADVDGVPYDLRATDAFVAGAVQARLKVLPVIMTAAPWAAENPFVPFSPPTDPRAFGAFAGVLAERYGPTGRFWTERSSLPRKPLRAWQVWNEPAGSAGFAYPSVFWESERNSLAGYVALLRAARAGLRRADPRARVVLGGLHGEPWAAVNELYGAGARKLFDAVALHPYTRWPDDVVRIVENVRTAMARNGDARKPIVVTEMSWPSAVGSVPDPFAFAVTAAQQPAFLRSGYRRLASARKRLGVRAVFWYSWMSADSSPTHSFDYAGLITRGQDGREVRKPAFSAFRRVARRLTR